MTGTIHLTFDTAPANTFADLDTRVIRGLALPAGETALRGGRRWRFHDGSVRFGDRTPLLMFHDTARPVGKLTGSSWTDRGLEVTFAVSKTSAGDEALVLAADGVLGLSVGVDVPDGGAKQTGTGPDAVLEVTLADCREVSAVPVPAFAGSVIDSVALAADTPISSTSSSTIPERTVPVTTTPEAAPVAVQLDADALGRSIAAAMSANTPQVQPVPRAQVREEAIYRFDGSAGRHGFVADMRDSRNGDGEAAQRLERFLAETFANDVRTTDVAPIAKGNPNLPYQQPLHYNRPLASLITTGTITNNTPFVMPQFGSAADLVAPHVEGVEPKLGSYTATSATITPGAVSGKVEITREAWDNSSPQVDALVWSEMVAAHADALERRVAALLDSLTLTPIAITGAGSAAVDSLTDALVDLQFVPGGNRFTSLAANAALYKAAINAKDADGRRLLPVLAPQNADGTTAASFGRFLVGTTTGVPVWGLTGASYLFVPSSVLQWSSAPRRLDFDIQVKSIFIGLWGYAAEACLRVDDVRKITYSAK